MRRKHGLLVTVLLGAGIALGVGYGIVHTGHRPDGTMDEIEVTAPRPDRVVGEVVATASGPELALPVVEVRAARHGWPGLADRAVLGPVIAN